MPITLPYGAGLTVEIALSAVTGLSAIWDADVWDTGVWGPDEVWQDVTKWVTSVSTDRQFNRSMNQWIAGQATVVLRNEDGRFSPANLSGPYVAAGVTGIRPWRPIRIRASWAGVSYDVYRGYVLAWQETYVSPYPGGGGVLVTLPCVDEYAALARFDGFAVPPVGADELTGVRIHRILDSAGHTGARNIDPGRLTVQATDMNANASQLLKVTQDSEGGALYVDKSGTVVFENYAALAEQARSVTVQALYGDGPGEVPYSDIAVNYDGDLVTNVAAYQRVGGGVMQVVTNEPSRALYRDKRQARADLISSNDAQVLRLAGFQVAKYANPEFRISSIQLNALSNPGLVFPQILSREIHDLVRVRHRPPVLHVIDQLVHIDRINHIVSGENWITNLHFWSAAYYQGVGRWDFGTWDTSTWFF